MNQDLLLVALLAAAMAAAGCSAELSLILPLKAAVPAPAPAPNKLRFHRNASLVVTLAVGTPPQNVSMALDTGSELSWLPCSRSSSPARVGYHSWFRPALSATYKTVSCASSTCQRKAFAVKACSPSPSSKNETCRVSLAYADASSADGVLAAEQFLLGQQPPPAATPVLFGCMSSAYDSSEPPTDITGLLGMNRGPLSFVTQAGVRRFAYCIAGDSGVLLLGGETSPPFAVPLNYTPLVQMAIPLPYFDRVAYSVELLAIRVAGERLAIPPSVLAPDHTGAGQTMVDSGTQFTFLLGDAYSVLKTEFLRRTRGAMAVLDEPDFVFQGAFDTCFRIPDGRPPSPALPEVALVLRGAEVAVAGEQLLYRVPGERRGRDGVWCLTFGNSDLVAVEAFVIGHHHQQNVWVEYDLDNGRVGFAPVQCDLAADRLGLAR